MRSANDAYVSIHDHGRKEKERPPWYWRLIAIAASWMILGGCVVYHNLTYTEPP